MEQLSFICEHLTLGKVAFELTNYLKINGFAAYQHKSQIEHYKFTNPKITFKVTLDYEDIVKASTKIYFELCEGDRELFIKKFKDAERLFATEKDPINNIRAIDVIDIYYDS
jgi:hypothetical protein